MAGPPLWFLSSIGIKLCQLLWFLFSLQRPSGVVVASVCGCPLSSAAGIIFCTTCRLMWPEYAARISNPHYFRLHRWYIFMYICVLVELLCSVVVRGMWYSYAPGYVKIVIFECNSEMNRIIWSLIVVIIHTFAIYNILHNMIYPLVFCFGIPET